MTDLPTIYEAQEAALEKMGPDDRSALSVAVRADLVAIIQGMVESAKGLQVLEVRMDKNGQVVEGPVYKKAPNMEVAQYLLNQLMGKPRETQVDFQVKNNIIVHNEIVVKKMS